MNTENMKDPERGRIFTVRHGQEDKDSEHPLGGKLLRKGVQQMLAAAHKILKILQMNPQDAEGGVTIYHTSMRRGKEAAQLMKDKINKKIPVNNVEESPILRHTDRCYLEDDEIKEYLENNAPLPGETHIYISHANTLKHIAGYLFDVLIWRYFSAHKKFPKIRNRQEYLRHGQVADEYGNPFDEEGKPIFRKSDKK